MCGRAVGTHRTEFLFLAVALIRLGSFTEAFDHLMAGYKLEIEGAESGPFPLT